MNRLLVVVALAGSVLSSAGASTEKSLICAYSGEPEPVYKSIPEQEDERNKRALNAASERIHGLLELRQNFEIELAGIPGAVAQVETTGGKRIMYFDRGHFRRLLDDEPTRRAAESILAHEIGHLLQGHTLDAELLVTQELEADAFSGRMMYMLGATLAEAQRAARLYTKGVQPGHPPQAERLLAVRRGWRGAREREDLPQRKRDYASAMTSVGRAIAAHDTTRANRILERFLPRPGTVDVRSFAWFHFWRQMHPEENFLVLPHEEDGPWRVRHLEVIPTSMLVAVSATNAQEEGTVFLYDFKRAPPGISERWPCLYGLFGLAFDGSWIVYAEAKKSANPGLRLRRLDSGRTFPFESKHPKTIEKLAASPDGTYVATADDAKNVVVWNLKTGETYPLTLAGPGAITSLTFTSDSKTFLAGSTDGHVYRISAASQMVRVLPDIELGGIEHVIAAPVGTRVAIGGERGLVQLDSLEYGKARHRVSSDEPASLQYSRDGMFLAAGMRNGAVRIFDAIRRPRLREFGGHVGSVDALAFFPDGSTLVTGDYGAAIPIEGPALVDGAIRIIDTTVRADVERHVIEADADLAAISADGRVFVTVAKDKESTLRVVKPSGELKNYAGTAPINTVAISPDGALIAGGTRPAEPPDVVEQPGYSCDCAVEVWSSATDERLFRLGGHDRPITSIAVAGDRMATASCDRIQIWQLDRERRHADFLKEIEDPDRCTLGNGAITIALSADGMRVAGVSSNIPAVKLWTTTDGSLERTFELPNQRGASAVAFSPDGAWLAVGSEDWDVTLWSLLRARAPITMSGHEAPPRALAFSPDSSLLISAAGGNEPVLLWDTDLGLRVGDLSASGGVLPNALTLAPSGRLYAATGGRVAARIIWHPATQETVVRNLRERFRGLGGREERESLVAALWASFLNEELSPDARRKLLTEASQLLEGDPVPDEYLGWREELDYAMRDLGTNVATTQ